MTSDFKVLVEEYGSGENIPSKVLYEFLVHNKADLINESKLGVDRIPKSNLGLEVRRRSQRDLKWLAQYFLWDSQVASEQGTRPVEENFFLDPQYDCFAELFVKKDPDIPIKKLSPVKTRILLWPRGGAKSSYDHIDTVQWIINYPNIRILYLTAEASLSKGFTSEIKGFFTLREDEPTFFNLFFPEHCCLSKDMGAGNVFTTPDYRRKKTGRKEPTVFASSVGKTKAGWRFELIKADDAVSDRNSETAEQCSTISDKLFLAEKLLMPGGFYRDYVGTRYAEEEHYGVLLEKYLNTGNDPITGKPLADIEVISGTGWVLTRNKTANVDILVGKACQIKPEVEERLRNEGKPVNYIEAGEDGCVLLLPTQQPYSWLMGEFTQNEKVFEGQLNQNPRVASQRGFTRLSLIKATIPYNMLPRSGPVSQFWDLSFSQKKGSDFCVGSSVMWGEEDVYDREGKKTGGRLTVGYVRKLIRDRFNPFTAAKAIVDLVVEERPFILGIEDAGGSKSLEPTIHAEAYKTQDSYVINVCTHIQWVTPNNQYDAKHIRMGSLIPWVEEGRMKFANFCLQPKYPSMDTLYDEFERCMFTKRHGASTHHHDDIPDNLGYQPMYAPQAVQALVENNTDMFYRVDHQGWHQLYDENYQGGGRGVVLQTDNQGNPIVWDPYATVTTDEWVPEPDVRADTPSGMDNVLGIGIFG
jgi:hypothetical protein